MRVRGQRRSTPLGHEKIVDLDDQRQHLGRVLAAECGRFAVPHALDAGADGLERPEAEGHLEPGGGDEDAPEDWRGDRQLIA